MSLSDTLLGLFRNTLQIEILCVMKNATIDFAPSRSSEYRLKMLLVKFQEKKNSEIMLTLKKICIFAATKTILNLHISDN